MWHHCGDSCHSFGKVTDIEVSMENTKTRIIYDSQYTNRMLVPLANNSIFYTYIVKLKSSKTLYLNTNPQIPIFQSNRNFPQKAKQLIRWGPNWQ